ncbi:hypothetical protein H8959_006710 [Pygathrix nigripes]
MATQNVPPPPYQDSPQMTATAQPPSKAQAVHISAPSAAASTPVPSAPIDPQAQLEADKGAVYSSSDKPNASNTNSWESRAVASDHWILALGASRAQQRDKTQHLCPAL